jgi:hypothetical protein
MAFSVVMRSCSGRKSLFPAKAGIVELWASFVAADLNIVDKDCGGVVLLYQGCYSHYGHPPRSPGRGVAPPLTSSLYNAGLTSNDRFDKFKGECGTANAGGSVTD